MRKYSGRVTAWLRDEDLESLRRLRERTGQDNSSITRAALRGYVEAELWRLSAKPPPIRLHTTSKEAS